MLDIKLIRKNPESVKQNLKRRGDAENLQMLDDLRRHDEKWRQLLTEANALRHERRKLTGKIADLKKAGKAYQKPIEKGRQLARRITFLEEGAQIHKQNAEGILMKLPNILHESVPTGKDDTNNVEVKGWGNPPIFDFKPKNHLEIGRDLGMIDEERGAKVSGHGFLYLSGQLVFLDLALQRFALDFMVSKGFRLVEPPYMMRQKPYSGVTDLADFERVMYKVEGEDLYMIATSEHPLAAMFMNEVFLKEDLPVKLVGVSPCFRKEVGTHGKYTKGLFRMHQFNKVEQFVFCHPEDSWKIHEELQANSEALYEDLGLHYKVVNVCTGDIGTVASKRYDINIWMADGMYREVGSNSNCTDYQSRRLNIRFREKEGQSPTGFVHTLNNTALATSRTMVALLEQHQQKDGTVALPKALDHYMAGLRRLEPHSE
ncbi:serine--tRNA ligase [Candidatus Bathyarchaeota archaeon]|nr:serine--tRNA ligase [Candidatus Bathyarchaeota archaeon]